MAKKLLNENTIRRFMKLADMNRLSETFIDELEEDDSLEEEMPPYARDEPELDLPPGEVPEDDVDVDADVEGECPEPAREDLLQVGIEALAKAWGVEVDFGGDAEEVEDVDVDVEPVPEPELPGPEEELMEKVLQTLDKANIEVVDEERLKENLVKQITARVAKRILEEKF